MALDGFSERRDVNRIDRTALLVAAIGATVAGCGPGHAGSIRPTVADSAGVEVVTTDPLKSGQQCTVGGAPFFAVGDALGDERYEFYNVRGMARLSDGGVAIIDRRDQRLRIFSESGEFVRAMGGRGEGPGEFRNPLGLWVLPGDTVWVGDYRPQRFLVFTADGDFVRPVTLDPFYANPSRGGGVLSNGFSVNVREEGGGYDYRTPTDVVVEAHGPDGALQGTLAVLAGAREGPPTGSISLTLEPLFQARPSFDANGATIAIANGTDPEVRLLDEQFNLERVVRWFDPDRDVTRAHVQAWREEYLERRAGNEGMLSEVAEITLSEDRPVADRFPAVSSLVVGRDGRIWVVRYRRPREDTGWLVFEPDGHFLCHLEPVPGLAVYEFGADYLLGARRDSLGVESVVMHELRLPAGTPLETAPGR